MPTTTAPAPLPFLTTLRLRRGARILLCLLGAWAWQGCGASLPVSPVVEIAPASAQVQAGGGQQQFTATVLNTTNTAVVWKVNGVLGGSAATGTVSQTGLYMAPAAVPAAAVAVEAVSVANDNSDASAAITLTAGVAINVAPQTATVAASATQQFTATVANASNTAVTWSVNGAVGGSATVGTISAGGLYTAPATFPGLTQVTIAAASVADPSATATAVVTLSTPPPAVTITVTPATATLNVGVTATFTATITGSANTAATWSVNGIVGGNATLGTITSGGVFTAPAAVPAPAAETVTATSQADPTQSATAAVTIEAPITLAVTPATATVNPGATQQFTATVANAQNTAVVWSVNGTAGGGSGTGTISSAGLYTAPSTYQGLSQVTIGAALVQEPTLTATAVVTLTQPVAVAISPTTASVNLGATQPFSAVVTPSGTSQAVTWEVNGIVGGNATLGTISTAGVFTAPTTLPVPAAETVTATSVANTAATATAPITLQAPPAQFTLTPTTANMSLGKAASGTQAFQVALSAGYAGPVTFAVSGLPTVNTTAALDQTSITASGTVNLTLTTSSISLAQSAVPVTLTATGADAGGAPIVQTATILLTINGWAGHIRTLAGGPGGVGFEDGGGTTDELYPSAIVTDGGQNLYFSDRRGDALRAYNLTSQTVTTTIGGPYNYTIPSGQGMAFNPATQTVYISDSTRSQIISFTLDAYDIAVVAGGAGQGYGGTGYIDGVGGAAAFDFPHGMALSPDGTTLYVADTNNEVIRAINIASQTVTTIAGQAGVYRSTDGIGTAASFCQPTGLDIDGAGANLYVTDDCGYVVRKIALSNDAVTTVAGSGAVGQSDGAALSATFEDPIGLKVDPHSGTPLLYISDNDAIRVLTLGASPTVYTLAGNAGPGQSNGTGSQASFYTPDGITALADAVGTNTTSLFVADSLNGLLRRLDFTNPLTATSAATAVVNVSTLAGQPSDRGSSDGVGTGTGYTGTSVAQFSQPEGIVIDPTSSIAYVADSENGAIREINLSNTSVTTIAGPAQGFAQGVGSAAAFYLPSALALVPSQNLLYISDTGNGDIRVLNLSTDTVSLVAGTNQSGYQDGTLSQALFNHPYGILASADGTKLYVADTGNNALRLIDLNAQTVTTIAGNGGLGYQNGTGTAATFSEPNGLAWDATQSNIFISDFENHAIREYNLASGAVTTLVGTSPAGGGPAPCGYTDGPAATATLCDPAFITTDGSSLFWGDSDTGLLRVLNLTTLQVSTLAGTPAVMQHEDGDLTESATNPGELVGPVLYNGVFGLAIAPNANFVLFADKTANVIRILY